MEYELLRNGDCKVRIFVRFGHNCPGLLDVEVEGDLGGSAAFVKRDVK